MTGSADNQSLFVGGAHQGDCRRCAVRAEVKDDVALADNGLQIVALINLADNLEVSLLRGTSDERAAHAAFGAGDDEVGHFNSPQRFIVSRSASRFFPLIGTRGKRYSSSIWPSMARAALTGTGLVSMNKSLNRGYHLWWNCAAARTFPAAKARTIWVIWRGITLDATLMTP